jgi:K+-transporting ATPase ATPase B chain
MSRRAFEAAIVAGPVATLVKLDPRRMIRNPVMFVVEVGSAFTTLLFVHALGHRRRARRARFIGAVALWLWFTVLFANFAEAMAEGRGKAQADTLRKARQDVLAKALARPAEDRRRRRGPEPSSQLAPGDVVSSRPASSSPATARSSRASPRSTRAPSPARAPRSSARAAATAARSPAAPACCRTGSWSRHRGPGRDLPRPHDRDGRGRQAQKTPNEIALDILLAALTIVFLLATVTLLPFSRYAVDERRRRAVPRHGPVLVALLVCLIPTTIGGLLSAIGIAGMDRLIQANVIATSGRAVEAAGDVDVLLLDKTGTITSATAGHGLPPGPGVTRRSWPTRRSWRRSPTRRPRAAASSVLAKERYGLARPTARGARLRPLHRPDAHERRRPRRAADPQGRGRRGRALGRGAGRRRSPPEVRAHRRRGRQGRAARRWWSPTARACSA